MDLIQQLTNDNQNGKGSNTKEGIDNKIKIAFEKINYLIDIYKQNNEDYYHKLIKDIFKIYEKEENNTNEEQNINDDNKEKIDEDKEEK